MNGQTPKTTTRLTIPNASSQKKDSPRPVKKPVRCYRCNQTGHYAYQCPTRNSGKLPTLLHSRSNRDDSSAEVNLGTAVSLQISHSLLTTQVEVVSEKLQGSDEDSIDSCHETVKAALDTMSSMNIVSAALVHRLGLSMRDDSTQLTSLGSCDIPGKGTSLRISVKGKGVITLYCLVLEEGRLEKSCQCELLVGFRDLKRLGVSILVPFPAPIASPHSLEDQIQVAKDYLRSVVGKWSPLAGAPNYRGRLRPVKPTDSLDTKQQC